MYQPLKPPERNNVDDHSVAPPPLPPFIPPSTSVPSQQQSHTASVQLEENNPYRMMDTATQHKAAEFNEDSTLLYRPMEPPSEQDEFLYRPMEASEADIANSPSDATPYRVYLPPLPQQDNAAIIPNVATPVEEIVPPPPSFLTPQQIQLRSQRTVTNPPEAADELTVYHRYNIAQKLPRPQITDAFGRPIVAPSPPTINSSSSEQEQDFLCSVRSQRQGDYRDWNEQFQLLLEQPTATVESAKERVEQIKILAQEFASAAIPIVTTIVSEMSLPDDQKTIKPLRIGLAGGQKYVVEFLTSFDML